MSQPELVVLGVCYHPAVSAGVSALSFVGAQSTELLACSSRLGASNLRNSDLYFLFLNIQCYGGSVIKTPSVKCLCISVNLYCA